MALVAGATPGVTHLVELYINANNFDQVVLLNGLNMEAAVSYLLHQKGIGLMLRLTVKILVAI